MTSVQRAQVRSANLRLQYNGVSAKGFKLQGRFGLSGLNVYVCEASPATRKRRSKKSGGKIVNRTNTGQKCLVTSNRVLRTPSNWSKGEFFDSTTRTLRRGLFFRVTMDLVDLKTGQTSSSKLADITVTSDLINQFKRPGASVAEKTYCFVVQRLHESHLPRGTTLPEGDSEAIVLMHNFQSNFQTQQITPANQLVREDQVGAEEARGAIRVPHRERCCESCAIL